MYRHLHALMIALVLAVGACTLPADDASEIPEQLDELAAESEVSALDEGSYERTYEDPDQGLIVCRLKVDHPHQSRHEPKNVNVKAEATCTSTVERIQMQVALMRNGRTVAGNSDEKPGRLRLKVNAAAACVDGIYQGTASATIFFPPGHNPNPQTLYETSTTRPVNCTFPASLSEGTPP